MPSTYDENLSTEKDYIRFRIGDRAATFILSDEEIVAINASEPNKFYAAAVCAQTIMTRGKGLVSKRVKQLEIEYADDEQSAYMRLIEGLRAEGAEELMPDTDGKAFIVL
jgi:hypothetical protein